MALYNENQVALTGNVISYQRAEVLVLRNESPPVIECHEQLRSIYPSGEIRNTSLGIFRHVADDMNLAIPLVDHETLEPIDGQFITAGQFYVMAVSVYMHLARERDAWVPPEEPAP